MDSVKCSLYLLYLLSFSNCHRCYISAKYCLQCYKTTQSTRSNIFVDRLNFGVSSVHGSLHLFYFFVVKLYLFLQIVSILFGLCSLQFVGEGQSCTNNFDGRYIILLYILYYVVIFKNCKWALPKPSSWKANYVVIEVAMVVVLVLANMLVRSYIR